MHKNSIQSLHKIASYTRVHKKKPICLHVAVSTNCFYYLAPPFTNLYNLSEISVYCNSIKNIHFLNLLTSIWKLF